MEPSAAPARDRARPGAGLFGSLKRLLHTGLGIAQVRLELFGTELEQEKLRLFDALWRAALALLLLGLAMVGLLAFLILLFQEGYRLAAIGVLTLLFAAAGAWLMQLARAGLRAPEGGLFALSLGELRRDRQSLGDGAADGSGSGTSPPAR